MSPSTVAVVAILSLVATFALSRMKSRKIASDLQSLPIGLEVRHFPSPAWAVKTDAGAGWRFIWQFETLVVVTIDRPLRIEKFGMGVWHRGRWLYSSSRRAIILGPFATPNCTVFSDRDFIREFNCPSGWLKPGLEASDHSNWAGSGRLLPFRQNWFFIGRDDEGRAYKGEAIIDLEGRLL
jgi:hypothetical protein